ncbi:MAG: hypothetical protein KJ718_02925 [Nanoarchaeota archaeon]|nr:hypothetical protein [Nanoarchaeota archaeon]MBU1051482.1 hypothetical protein [Nanoarchaeota archaeon]MBU1988091.1 hypothetical protein [Nanoarchaeota archaeon]
MFFKRKKKFPTLAVIVLVFAIAWLFSELGYLKINIPWIPLILIIVAVGWIVNRYMG